MAHFQWESGGVNTQKRHWQPGMPAPPPPPPMDPVIREQLINIKKINELLKLISESSEISLHLDKLTVIAALRMWTGREQDEFVERIDPVTIQNCEGVKMIYPYIKQLEELCIAILLPFSNAIDAIEQRQPRLSDECLIARFDEKYCRVNHLLKGRMITKSEREEMRESMTTRIPSFIVGGAISALNNDDEDESTKSTGTSAAAPPPTYVQCALDYQSTKF